MTKKLKLSEIVTDAGTQVRAEVNEETVAEYAEAMAAGAKFPPVTVFGDGIRYVAADGFHRILAASQTGATQIQCDIRKGGKTDALRFALGCNAVHGLRRTNADKRHAVELAIKEFSKFSNATIAKMCLAGHELVSEIRKSQPPDNQTNQTDQPYDSVGLGSPPTRIGWDGRKRRLPPPPRARRAPDGTDETNGTGGPPGTVPAVTPPPSQVLDEMGYPIPPQVIPLWQRGAEVQKMLTDLIFVKGTLRRAQENKDKLFAEVSFSSALSHLEQAFTDVKTAMPFAVCPSCQGQLPNQCTLCKGRGFISEHCWKTCVTREAKEIRFKAQHPASGKT